MRILSIAQRRPFRVPGTEEWEREDAIPGPIDRVRRIVSRRTRAIHKSVDANER